MDVFLQHTVNGVAIGMTYVMFATGFALIFGVMYVINFAHGEFYMLGGMLTYSLMTNFGLNYLLSIPLTVLLIILLALICNRFAVQPLLNMQHLMMVTVISTMGLSMFLSNLAALIWGPAYKTVYSPLKNSYFYLGNAAVEWQKVFLIAFAVACMLALAVFLYRTKTGKSMRAAAQNKVGAAILGIDVKRVYATTFVIAAVLAALAGILVAPSTWAEPYIGPSALVKAFVVVILAGLGNITGVIGAGLLLGLAEAYFGAYVSFPFTDAFAYSLIIILLLVRPQGLFIKSESR